MNSFSSSAVLHFDISPEILRGVGSIFASIMLQNCRYLDTVGWPIPKNASSSLRRVVLEAQQAHEKCVSGIEAAAVARII